jgi:hypothetical protein
MYCTRRSVAHRNTYFQVFWYNGGPILDRRIETPEVIHFLDVCCTSAQYSKFSCTINLKVLSQVRSFSAESARSGFALRSLWHSERNFNLLLETCKAEVELIETDPAPGQLAPIGGSRKAEEEKKGRTHARSSFPWGEESVNTCHSHIKVLFALTALPRTDIKLKPQEAIFKQGRTILAICGW